VQGTVQKELPVTKRNAVTKRKATSTPKKSQPPVTTSKDTASHSDNETMADSVAIFIGKNVGKAVKRTRALGDRLSQAGAEVADVGSRAGKTLKEYLPEALGGAPARSRQGKASAGTRARKTKTVAPKPAHGHDAITEKASAAMTKPAKVPARAATGQKRALSPRRG
jgi:hypothetical protein